jgi:hypothetical protein
MIQQFERDGRPSDESGLRAGIFDACGPPRPRCDGGLEQRLCLRRLARMSPSPPQEHGDRPGAAAQAQSVAARLDLRAAPRRDGNPHPRRSVHDFDETHEDAATGRGVLAEVGAGPEREGVGQAHERRPGPELRDEDGRVLEITLPRRLEVLQRDREGAAVRRVEQPAEQSGRVEARHAQPGDGAVPPDQRRRRPVADETVILEGQKPIEPSNWGEPLRRQRLLVVHGAFSLVDRLQVPSPSRPRSNHGILPAPASRMPLRTGCGSPSF